MNFFINAIIYFSSKKENYLKLTLFWLSLIINFVIQAKVQNGVNEIIYGFGFSIVPLTLLGYSSYAFINKAYPWKKLTPVAFISILVTMAIIDKDLPFTLKALPFAFAGALPLLAAFFTYVFAKDVKSTALMKFHGMILLGLSIHTFNFAFFRMIPETQIWGWPVAYALYQILAGLIPALTLDFYHREEGERLKRIIEEKTYQLQDTNEELQATLQQKQYLFRTLTHDISTPLSAARLTIGLFERKKGDFSQFVKRISELNMRMEQLVNQVRDFESIQFGSKSFPTRENNLLSCISQVESLFAEKIAAKNINVSYDPDQLAQIQIMVDFNSFVNSVLMNIFSNSIKFCKPGGCIKISAREENNGEVILSIEDNGIGMPPKILNRLFDFEAKTSRRGTENEPGTGFGMPIIKKIVEAYGGQIAVTSAEQSPDGHSFTRFDITLCGPIDAAKRTA